MRWLQCADAIQTDAIQTAGGIAMAGGDDLVAPLRREEFTQVSAEIATDAETVGTPTNDRRNNVWHTRQRAHALNHGDAID
jgi:hypothetical protein